MKKSTKVVAVIMGVLVLMVCIYNFVSIKYKPKVDKTITLEKTVTTPEEAIQIAKHYFFDWDKRALPGHLEISYSKEDLLKNNPEFQVDGAWSEKTWRGRSEGSTYAYIKKDKLEFWAIESEILGIGGNIGFQKDISFPSYQDTIDILNLIAATSKTNWQKLDDFSLVIYCNCYYPDFWQFKIKNNDLENYFNYYWSTKTVAAVSGRLLSQ